MSLKISDLGTPHRFGTFGNRWIFGEGDGTVSLVIHPTMKGNGCAITCLTDTSNHACVHIRALERHLSIQDFRNERKSA